jgi:hypothetical protein
MFGFVRMTAIVTGSAIVALTSFNWYLGTSAAPEALGMVPGYQLLCSNPAAAGCLGAVLIVGALLWPTGSKKPRGWN